MNQTPHLLDDIADQTMIDRGFLPEFPEAALQEVRNIRQPARPTNARDLTRLAWMSIDNDDSKDLDQLTYAEKVSEGQDRIYVAVADVNALVKKGSAIDGYASTNTTSIYTPSKIYPMLPPELSTDLTSLNPDVDRSAVVIEVDVYRDGRFELSDIYLAIVHNHAKLAYNNVSDWLEGRSGLAENGAKAAGIPEQLKLQDDIATRIKKYREDQGALSFKTTELKPVVEAGVPVELKELDVNRARLLIENFMIAANVAMTTYMSNRNIPVIRRVVRTPKRWERIVSLAKEYNFDLPADPDAKALQAFLIERRKADPDRFPDLSLAIIKLVGRGEYIVAMPGDKSIGHFDLALAIYSHTTAPNRRYPDLVMQRLVEALFNEEPSPYTETELTAIAEQCTLKEDEATKVERRVLKSAAAMVMEHQIGRTFTAMVTGVNQNGTWIRLLNPPIEGKLVKGDRGTDVGDHITVKLIHVDVLNGYIDFARTA